MDDNDIVYKIQCPQCHKPIISHSSEKALLCTYLMTATIFNMAMLDKLKDGGGPHKDVDWDSLEKNGV